MVRTTLLKDYKKLCSNSNLLKGCGGKGRNLFVLKKAGFNVPEFVVITEESIKEIFKDIIPEIDSLLKKLHSGNDKTIAEIAEEIKKTITSYHVNSIFSCEIISKLEEIFGVNFYVSVRSSANSEDGASDSFAGILSSYMFVAKDNIIEKISMVYASAFSERALKYMILKNIDPDAGKMAIVIQTMIDSKNAGVAFSRDVTGNMNDVLIVAGYGLGEGIVSDKTDTDSYYVERNSNEIRSIINFKNTFLVNSPDKKKLTETSVTEENKKAAVLSEKEIIEIKNTVLEIEALMSFPQDIEFCKSHDGQLYILQSRNITTINASEIKILDNSNIVESYPGITRPLTFSFAKSAYENVFSGTMKLFKISESDQINLEPALQHLIAHHKGRVYYNLHHWYKIVSKVIASEQSLKAWENLVGIKQSSSNDLKISRSKKLFSLYVLISLIFKYKRICANFFRFFNSEYKSLNEFLKWSKEGRTSPTEIFTFFEQKSKLLFEGWAPTIVNDFFTFKSFDLLKKISSKKTNNNNIANDLLCGIEGVESELPVLELLKLTNKVKSNKFLSEIFKNKPGYVLYIISSSQYTDFKSDFDNYIKKYGDRVLEELKLETPNLRMKPEKLVSMIQNQLETNNTVEAIKSRQTSIRTNAEKEIRKSLILNPVKKLLFEVVLGFTKQAVRNRENMRFARTRAYGVVKELFAVIGSYMVDENVIDAPEDISWLEVSEVKQYCNCGDSGSFRKIISERKAEYAAYENLKLADKIMYQGDTVPSTKENAEHNQIKEGSLLGLGVSGGIIKGTAMIVHKPSLELNIKGEILVTKMTDPGWIFLMAQAGGIISEKGSLLSHTAIVGRELGIPTIVGVTNATTLIENGERIEINGEKGEIKKIL